MWRWGLEGNGTSYNMHAQCLTHKFTMDNHVLSSCALCALLGTQCTKWGAPGRGCLGQWNEARWGLYMMQLNQGRWEQLWHERQAANRSAGILFSQTRHSRFRLRESRISSIIYAFLWGWSCAVLFYLYHLRQIYHITMSLTWRGYLWMSFEREH